MKRAKVPTDMSEWQVRQWHQLRQRAIDEAYCGYKAMAEWELVLAERILPVPDADRQIVKTMLAYHNRVDDKAQWIDEVEVAHADKTY